MIRILLAYTCLLAVCGGALAADEVVYQPGASTYNWSGLYVGAAVGLNKLSVEGGDDVRRFSDGGASGAIYAGYNHQFGNVVLGVEADLKFSGAEIEDSAMYIPYEARLAGSARVRAGYALGTLLPYVTGGVAIGSFRGDHGGQGNSADFATETLTGYAVGGGVEWAATEKLIVRAEYIYSDYGTNDFDYYDGDIHDADIRSHDFRLGVAYKF